MDKPITVIAVFPLRKLGEIRSVPGVVKIEDCRQNWQGVTVQLGIMGSPGS